MDGESFERETPAENFRDVAVAGGGAMARLLGLHDENLEALRPLVRLSLRGELIQIWGLTPSRCASWRICCVSLRSSPKAGTRSASPMSVTRWTPMREGRDQAPSLEPGGRLHDGTGCSIRAKTKNGQRAYIQPRGVTTSCSPLWPRRDGKTYLAVCERPSPC